MTKLLMTIACLLLGSYLSAAEGGRLLVALEEGAAFTPQEFAAATGATLIDVDPRNPFAALQPVCLDEQFVVLSAPIGAYDRGWGSRVLLHLSARCGYRCVTFKSEALEAAAAAAREMVSTVPQRSSQLQQLTPEEAASFYNLMAKIDKVLTDSGIGYWAGRETLLGALTHAGMLPWDDYLHLFIFDTEEEKLLAAAFEEQGLVLHPYFKDFYKVYTSDARRLEDPQRPGEFLPFCYPAANIYVMTLEKRHEIEDVYVHRSQDFYFNWNHDRFDYVQVAEPVRIPFGPLSLPTPRQPERYLSRLYGFPQNPDLWKTHVCEPCWDHRHERWTAYDGTALVEIDN